MIDPAARLQLTWIVIAFVGAYLFGSIPWAYLIVRWTTGEDITTHGTGNVGAMNVKRTTGSWAWFTVAMVADASKGIIPAYIAKLWVSGYDPLTAFTMPWGATLETVSTQWWLVPAFWVPMAAVAGSVIGHNYSCWLAIRNRKFVRTGKGLATGGGAVLSYDWRYFLIVVIVGLLTIAITKYMMAGQVSAALSLPVGALVLRSPDWPFALFMGLVVYAAHHKRFVGMLQGKEPKLYTGDGMGPRG
ncbi:MAG: glycerol-3-phosphate acyltransferase [Coriobacteriia bacterium]|nr:glycerol-3-phosphate acyltransferase [Coriobacteriia bacterium]